VSDSASLLGCAQLVDQSKRTVHLAKTLVTDGSVPATLEGQYYEALTEIGIVDFDRTIQKERQRAQKELLATLRDAEDFVLDRSEFETAGEGLPAQIVDRWERDFRRLGLLRVGEDAVAYRPNVDPWRGSDQRGW
jgi:hypothetical protein